MRSRLQALRIGVAVGVGCLFTVAILGPATLALSLAATLPRAQVGPALYRLLGLPCLAAGLVVAVVALVTLVAGRVYCAAWCPLGLLQDAIRFLARRLPALRRWQERLTQAQACRPHGRRVVRWAVLTVTALSAVLGFTVLGAVLEPYSALGRLATQLGGPLLHAGQGVLSHGLERIDVYALSASPLPVTPVVVLVCTGTFLLAFLFMAGLGGRLYCTTICPVGTGLGLLAHVAPLRVRIDPADCTRCGLCVRRCRAACIRVEGDAVQVDQASCVACMDCLAMCPSGAVRYGLAPGSRSLSGAPGSTIFADRRELLAGGAATALTALALPLRGPAPDSAGEDAAVGPVTPPGSGSREHFAQNCTACQLCVTVCPMRVLKPAWLEYGVSGILQPRLSFQDGFCEYDCRRCLTVCPSGALKALSLAEKQRTQLGVARLHRGRCIVYCRGEACGACVEVCPTHAVHAQERDGLLYPEMATGACIGCGACEYACPENPKAIAVVASAVHGRAALPYVPETPELPAPLPSGTKAPDFPF